MNDMPLTDEEMDFIEQMLDKYGHEESILSMSELDGFLTALVAGPNAVMPSVWYAQIWGELEPEWESMAEAERFMQLVVRQMNYNAAVLQENPAYYEALFMYSRNDDSDKPVCIVEDWCCGFLQGVIVAEWGELPDEVADELHHIALHGSEEFFDVLDKMSLAQHQHTVTNIEPAVRKLYQYWQQHRRASHPPIIRQQPKIGRNDLCPCGSGKKFKKCCLH